MDANKAVRTKDQTARAGRRTVLRDAAGRSHSIPQPGVSLCVSALGLLSGGSCGIQLQTDGTFELLALDVCAVASAFGGRGGNGKDPFRRRF